jgi:hypothetical protein
LVIRGSEKPNSIAVFFVGVENGGEVFGALKVPEICFQEFKQADKYYGACPKSTSFVEDRAFIPELAIAHGRAY